MSGTLYIVATPVGNLGDITLRALEILRQVDAIACEDTRRTHKLMEHYGIQKPLISYHEHNEQARAEELVARLESGNSLALVSDAGTPLIADPGYRIVQLARSRNIPVSPVPGPSALIAALSASGLPTDSFFFAGFLPSKSGQRRQALEACKAIDATCIFYEAPHRILLSLEDVGSILGERPLVLARELTKMHEEFLAGTAVEILAQLKARSALKGEFVLMIGKGGSPEAAPSDLDSELAALMDQGMPRMEALKTLAKRYGVGKRDLYSRLENRGGHGR